MEKHCEKRWSKQLICVDIPLLRDLTRVPQISSGEKWVERKRKMKSSEAEWRKQSKLEPWVAKGKEKHSDKRIQY